MNTRLYLLISALACVLPSSGKEAEPAPKPPGVVIAYSPAASGLYIGSPGIAILTNGDYLASHDFFGPKSEEHVKATTVLYRSTNRGQSWNEVRRVSSSFWANLFVHQGAVYLMGTDRHHGRIVIRRSVDNGETWTEPVDGKSGVIQGEGEFHTAPMPVLEHADRLWRAFEDASGGTKWGIRYQAGMMSIRQDADLLNAANWTFSNFLKGDTNWLNGRFGGWLEGNAVLSSEGKLLDILRVDTPSLPEKAALVEISQDGSRASFDPDNGFIDFPGGAKKFSIRYHEPSKAYWALATLAEPGVSKKPASIRNTLVLVRSKDLHHWEVRSVLVYHPDVAKHGFQYPAWLFDGEDIIAAVRTAYDDGKGGAHNNHDANFLTFHRFQRFQELQDN